MGATECLRHSTHLIEYSSVPSPDRANLLPGMKPARGSPSGTVRPRPRPPKTRGGTLSWEIEHAPSAANPVVQWPFRTHPLTGFQPSHSGTRPGVRTARSKTLRLRPRLEATGTATGPTAAPLR